MVITIVAAAHKGFDMITKTTFFNIIDVFVSPTLKKITTAINTALTNYKTKKIVFKGGVSAEATIVSEQETAPIIIPTFVDPLMHDHTELQLPVSVQANPKTIAKRTETGKLVSSQSSMNNSGYKISDGRDVTSLFQTMSDTYLVFKFTKDNVDTTSATYGVVANAVLTKAGNTITLATTYNGYCSFGGENCYDCCS